MSKDIHGGNIYKFDRKILDYSSNINPLGVPEIFKQKVIENFNILTAYPDPHYNKLRESIASFNDLDKNNIVVGNGATEVLFLTMKTLNPKKTLIIAPTFAEYTRAIKNIGNEIIYYKLEEENNFKLDVDKFIDFIEDIKDLDLVIICNPNNPTGQFIELSKIKKINDFLKTKNIKLFIDEAFIEFIENNKKQTSANLKDKNIYIMRALTKFFAIPGLRLGYMISFDSEYIRKINSIREPWSVNSFADLAGRTMLWDREYIEKTEAWIKEEKIYFYNNAKKIENIKVYKTNTNFILIQLLSNYSNEIREKMIEKNILVRDASNFYGLNNRFIRLAIKNRKNNKIVLKALNEVING